MALIEELGIRRIGNEYPVAKVQRHFQRYGIVVLKEFLPRDTQSQLRDVLERKLSDARKSGGVLKFPEYPKADFLLGDLLAIRELEKYQFIFFAHELLALLRVLLGAEELLYFGDSSVQFGEAARGFHKDNVDRYDGTKADWIGQYGLIRCGFYFQDHVRHSGGLKIRLSSHDIPNHRQGRILDVDTCYGDVVLWNMRLTHSGNNKRLRLFSGLRLHPRLEMICPALLTLPEQCRRIAAFCAFGAPGPHVQRYTANLTVREADYKAYLQRARKPAEASPLLSKLGVSLIPPNAYYGELD